ncbi:hypothetical protein Tco_0308581 [Tanacetum coccineum]
MTGNKSLFSTYKAYNGVEESLNVKFDESHPPIKLSSLVDDDISEEEAIRKNTKIVNTNNEEDESIEVDEIINIKESKNHPLDQVIGNLNQRNLRSQAQNHSKFFCFISIIEPKNVNKALKDESWVVAMQEELNQFVANDVWELVPLPVGSAGAVYQWHRLEKLRAPANNVVSYDIKAVENVIENESHFSLEVVDQDLSSLAMFTKHLMGGRGGVGSNSAVGEGKEESIRGIGGGSFAKHSIVAKDGLGGDGFVVEGGRSPSTSSKDGEDGEVANKSSMGSRLVVTGEIVVERLLEKLVGLPMCSLMVERMVDREERRFLD